MSDLDSQTLRQQLLTEQTALREMESANHDATATVELDQSKVGRLSRMDALQGQAMAKATEARRKQRLKDIALALQRIETDDYGFCEACDEPIPEARLHFDPAARFCVRCADSANQ